ncbi:MAG: hypothetical protein AAFQ82_01735 [Myxococcota bacterium]
MRYIAFGSHLHPLPLLERIESTRFVGTAELVGWTLRFNARGADGGGRCTLETSAASAHVAVYDIHRDEVAKLESMIDSAHRPMRFDLGAHGQGIAYVAERRGQESPLPYEWYRDLVLAGALYHQLPQSVISRIEAQRTIVDPDHVRRAQNKELLNRAQAMLSSRL